MDDAPRWVPPSAALRPVLVVGGSGRTGSTMLMAMLAAMPEVAFDRRPPYEVLHLTHLAQVASTWRGPSPQDPPSTAARARIRRRIERDVLPRLHSEPLAHRNTTGPTGGEVPARRVAAPHLLDDDHQVVPFDQRFLAEGWASLAAALDAGHRAAGGAAARWYAEKPPLWLDAALDGVVAHHVVARVRDPRDTFCSHRAFFRRRSATHGRRGGERDDLGYLRRFAQQQRDYGRWLAANGQRPSLRVVRYEDAVADPLAAARGLADWLEVALDADALVANLALSETAHVTAGSTVASVARWRRDLSAREQAIAADAFGEALELLGYEP